MTALLVSAVFVAALGAMLVTGHGWLKVWWHVRSFVGRWCAGRCPGRCAGCHGPGGGDVSPARDELDALLASLLDEEDELPDYACFQEHLEHWQDMARKAAAEVLRLRALTADTKLQALWEGETCTALIDSARCSVVPALHDVPPGTRVRVVSAGPLNGEAAE